MYKIGDKVRENRQGSKIETIIAIHGNVLITDAGIGSSLHITKAIKA